MTISAGTAVSDVRSAPITERRFFVPFVLITSLFFLWAFGVNLNDILIPHLKNVFGLSDFQSLLCKSRFLEDAFSDPRPSIYFHRHRVCTGTNCGNEFDAITGLPGGGSEHGQRPVSRDRRNFCHSRHSYPDDSPAGRARAGCGSGG